MAAIEAPSYSNEAHRRAAARHGGDAVVSGDGERRGGAHELREREAKLNPGLGDARPATATSDGAHGGGAERPRRRGAFRRSGGVHGPII